MKKNSFKIRVVCLMLLLHIVALPLHAQQSGKNMPVHVTVTFTDGNDNKDYILYHKKDHLSIKDFKGDPDADSHGVGATYSGMQMSMEGAGKNGVMEISVTLTVYFDKTKSWMKPEGKTPEVLAHEQIHFDLTGISACALAEAIMKEKYTMSNFKTKLRALQVKYTKGLSEQQQAYDKETIHGTLPDKQKQWAQKVAQQLEDETCI